MDGKKLGHIKLSVITGPDRGLSFDVHREATIGRDGAQCDIVLNDPAVSSVHARIVLGNPPGITDMGSQNHIIRNGVEIFVADLDDEDEISLGNTTLRVYMIYENPSATGKKEDHGRHYLLIIAVIMIGMVIGGFVYSTRARHVQRLHNQSIVVQKYARPIQHDFQGILTPVLPDSDSIFPAPDVYQAGMPPFYKRISEYVGPQSLTIQEDKPMPPRAIFCGTGPARDWRTYPPRLGGGRFIKDSGFVLGDYQTATFIYTNEEYASGFTDDSGTFQMANLEVRFYIETWDGLPPSMRMDYVSLDRISKDINYEKRPRIPKKYFQNPIASQLRDIKDDHREGARSTRGQGLTYEILQIRQGESLIILTAQYWGFQEKRIRSVVDQLLGQQEPGDRRRNMNPAELIAAAIELENRADSLLQGDPTQFSEATWRMLWPSEIQIARLLQAYNHYHLALTYLQVADQWQGNPDYQRIFEKAGIIFTEVQNPAGFFESERIFIESSWDNDSKIQELIRRVDLLYKITLESQQPEKFAVDDWFLYARQRKLDLQKRSALLRRSQ